ncbi:MAG: sugar transporter substrate-binding protein [Polyangiaceae bacterium]|jgi:ribose transport system substrate-binding protein|nr:sugar transporter substrate-binding protein [Polyangiaceae bacterium]
MLCALPLACKKSEGGAPGKLRIAVVPKGTTHEFWKAVHAGAAKAARELSVEIIWKGPLKEDDLKSQVDLVQSFTAQGVSGMVLAPLNDTALVAPVRAAVRSGVPVVIFDSDLKGGDQASFVATDNRAAGRLAGEKLGALLGGKGNVLLLRYQEGSASTNHREEGFVEALRKFPEVKLLSANQYGGATTESAFAASENLLLAQNAGKGQVQGVFCPNESTTFGMLLALEKAGLAGKVHFIGFDASAKLVEGVRAGKLSGLVLQNPFNMGYLAVKTLVAHLKKEKVESRIDTGAALVDKQNMDQPEMKALLSPPTAP